MLSQNDKYNFLSTNRDFVKIIKDFLQTEVDIYNTIAEIKRTK
jgi:hypothetical protein